MAVNLDELYQHHFKKFSQQKKRMWDTTRIPLDTTERALFILLVLEHEGHQCSQMIENAKNFLAVTYARMHVGSKALNILPVKGLRSSAPSVFKRVFASLRNLPDANILAEGFVTNANKVLDTFHTLKKVEKSINLDEVFTTVLDHSDEKEDADKYSAIVFAKQGLVATQVAKQEGHQCEDFTELANIRLYEAYERAHRSHGQHTSKRLAERFLTEASPYIDLAQMRGGQG